MRAVWSGQVCFHNLKFSVRLVPSVQKQKFSLHTLHASCQSRVSIEKKCPIHGTISRQETTRGYALEPGQYIVLDNNSLSRLQPRSSHRLEIHQFVLPSAFEPVDFLQSYYILPKPAHQKPYAIFRNALRNSGLYGTAKIFIQQSERLAAVWIKAPFLMASTLTSDSERLDLPPLYAKTVDLQLEKEDILRAEKLIEHRRSFVCKPHEDSYRERILDLLGQKIVRIASENELGFAGEVDWPAQEGGCAAEGSKTL